MSFFYKSKQTIVFSKRNLKKLRELSEGKVKRKICQTKAESTEKPLNPLGLRGLHTFFSDVSIFII